MYRWGVTWEHLLYIKMRRKLTTPVVIGILFTMWEPYVAEWRTAMSFTKVPVIRPLLSGRKGKRRHMAICP